MFEQDSILVWFSDGWKVNTFNTFAFEGPPKTWLLALFLKGGLFWSLAGKFALI